MTEEKVTVWGDETMRRTETVQEAMKGRGEWMDSEQRE